MQHATALCVAAIRETLEEAGVLFGTPTEPMTRERARVALNAKASFEKVAIDHDLRFHVGELHPYARWITPVVENKRFDTRFYIARLPENQHATHDGSETVSANWMSPEEALDQAANRTITLAPPTQKTLEFLRQFASSDAAIAASRNRKPPLVDPEVVVADKGWFLALPGDPDHSRSERAIEGATRLILKDGRWVDFS